MVAVCSLVFSSHKLIMIVLPPEPQNRHLQRRERFCEVALCISSLYVARPSKIFLFTDTHTHAHTKIIIVAQPRSRVCDMRKSILLVFIYPSPFLPLKNLARKPNARGGVFKFFKSTALVLYQRKLPFLLPGLTFWPYNHTYTTKNTVWMWLKTAEINNRHGISYLVSIISKFVLALLSLYMHRNSNFHFRQQGTRRPQLRSLRHSGCRCVHMCFAAYGVCIFHGALLPRQGLSLWCC